MTMFVKRKKFLIAVCLPVMFLLAAVCFFIFPDIIKAQKAEEDFIPDELLIKLKGNSKIYKIKIRDDYLLERQKIILEIPEVEWAEPNYLFRISYLPDDPYYHEQWYLNKIKAPQAWDLTKGGGNYVAIAVLDTGVDINHPDLEKNIWVNQDEIKNDGIDNDNNGYIDDFNGWDFVRSSPSPKPKFDEPYNEGGINHGTLVAGIAAAVGDNNEGVLGLAWQSKIMPLRVLNSEGVGSVEHVIQAVKYAVNNGANIINLSFVGTSKSYFLAEALKDAWLKGIIIVAAAGNETVGQPVDLNKFPNYPICLDEGEENFIIGVAAVDNVDKKALFSDYGSNCVDVSAPGTRIYGPLVYNPNYEGFKEYYGGYWSGTSIAAPMVSGLAALVWSVNPLFTHKQVQSFILSKADEIDSLNPDFAGQLGKGRINAYKTVEYAYNQLGGLPQSYYIVTGAGPTGGPHVRVFDSAGLPINGFFAYNENFRGGVNVASGDVDGDGKDEIITGAGKGSGPYVKIFNQEGELKKEILAYDYKFKGGVNVASGDVDGDGKDEIITGAGPTGGPHVRVFDNQGNLKFHFFAFNKNFRGGVNVASGDVDGDGKDEIITSVASEASSYIRVFSSEFLLLRFQFLAYSKDFYNGVKIAAADFDGNQQVEIIAAPGPSIEPQIEVFDSLGNQLSQFYAYTRYFKGGVSVTTMRTQGY